MSSTSAELQGTGARARAWHHAGQAAVCDVLEPWAHGTVARATRYPTYYNFNVVRVEEEPGMSTAELAAFADAALAGLEHRRLDFELLGPAQERRAELVTRGWKASRLLWMRHEHPPPPAPDVAVEEVDYDEVEELRLSWHREDFGAYEYESYRRAAKEVARARGVRVLAVREDGSPVAFAQLEQVGDGAEITQVYVHPDRRGAGRGTAMTRAAILAAGAPRDLWIVADDEDRPKHLYARLGFRPAWRTMEFLLLP